MRLYDFATDDPISADLAARGLDCVTLRACFPSDYPTSPPFVYVLRPRLKEHTGYVLNGGGICMELLTPQGWSPATSIDALVQSTRAMLMAGRARLRCTTPSTREADYSYEEARRDFAHIVKIHKKNGWTSHPMFKNS
jgi:ubiquitin-conjugating enzyme E2 Q